MHHCVTTYVEAVRQGTSYIFSVRRDGNRVATISLSFHNETILIQQLRGSCNTAPPKAVSAAVRKWLHAQRTTLRQFVSDTRNGRARRGSRAGLSPARTIRFKDCDSDELRSVSMGDKLGRRLTEPRMPHYNQTSGA